MTERLLLTPAEAASALGLGRTKFYELLDAGEVESFYVGRARRIPIKALQDFVDRESERQTKTPT